MHNFVLCIEPGQIHPINGETAESCKAPWTGQKKPGTRDQWTPSRSSEATKVHPAAGERARPLHQRDQQLDAEGKRPGLEVELTDVLLLTPGFSTSTGATKSDWSWSERQGAVWLQKEGLRGGVQAHAAGEPAGVCREGEEPAQPKPPRGSGAGAWRSLIWKTRNKIHPFCLACNKSVLAALFTSQISVGVRQL